MVEANDRENTAANRRNTRLGANSLFSATQPQSLGQDAHSAKTRAISVNDIAKFGKTDFGHLHLSNDRQPPVSFKRKAA